MFVAVISHLIKYLAEPVETTRPLPLHQPIADQDYLHKNIVVHRMERKKKMKS